MPLVVDSIPNLIGGVSQQAAKLRIPGQGELQENCISDIVQGLIPRPCSEFLAKLQSSTTGGAFIHTINRDSSERYIVVITDGDLKVFDLEGNEKTVAFPDGKGYLDVAAAGSDFQAVTVADYTFIVNKTITAAMDAAVVSSSKDANNPTWLVTIDEGVKDNPYRINVAWTISSPPSSGITASYTPATIANADPTNIASNLSSNIDAGSYSTATYQSNIVYVTGHPSTPDTWEFSLDEGAAYMTAVQYEVAKFSDLPLMAPEGYKILVKGADVSGSPDPSGGVYVSFSQNSDAPTSAGPNEGVWEETVGWGVETTIDAATMPHQLVREADGTFTFQEATWTTRQAGDGESNPDPSFIGQTISDVFFFKNRLGFLSGDNVILSENGEFFNFFRTTMSSLLDSDPIDVAVSTTRVAKLKHALPFGEDLVLLAESQQFVLRGGDLLTPSTVSANPMVAYETDTDCLPAAVGKSVFFAVPRGSYSGVRELFSNSELDSKSSKDITSQVPQYLPSGLQRMVGSTAADMLVATPAPGNALYIYEWFRFGDTEETQQSAWHKWIFDSADDILSVDFIENILYLVVERSHGLYLEKINLSPNYVDSGATYLTRLDRRVSEADVSPSYDSINDETTCTLPWDIDTADDVVVAVRTSDPTLPPGSTITQKSASGTSVVLEGDHTSSKFYIGQKYRTKYRVTPPSIQRSTDRGGLVAAISGRLQLRKMDVLFEDTAYIRAEVTPLNRGETAEYVFEGFVLGEDDITSSDVNLKEGKLSVYIGANADKVTIDLVSDSWLPFRLLAIDWKGFFHDYGQRLR